MPKLVVTGATLSCTEGLSPGTLLATTQSAASAEGTTLATILDIQPLTNVTGFGMCNTASNPAVAAATSAASGAHTPAPCIPVIASPWTSGASRVRLGGVPALTVDSRCTCSYGGQITIEDASQGKVEGE